MPQIHVQCSHHLTPAEAAQRLRQFGDKLKQKHGDEVKMLKEDWQDETLNFSLAAKGVTVSGRLIVGPQQIDVTCDLPFAAMLFRGRIEKDIRNTLSDALAAEDTAED